MRATLTLDLAAIGSNFDALSARCSSTIDPVLKAEAYGLGVHNLLDYLYERGCRRFYFADWESIPERNSACHDAEFFALNGVLTRQDGSACLARNIVPVLNRIDSWQMWKRVAPRAPYAIHADSGMNRLGMTEEEARIVAQCRDSSPTWLISHLACADNPANPYNARQLRAFQRVAALFPHARKSLANSSGVFLDNAYHFDAARVGAALYGLNPVPQAARNPMTLALTLSVPILQLRTIDAGESVGYARAWVAPNLSQIAICACGYGDGYPFRAQAQGGYALVNGQKSPIRGRVSMDFIAIDVTAVGNVHVGDQAILMSNDLPPSQIAESASDLDYNIMLQLARGVRAERVLLAPSSSD